MYATEALTRLITLLPEGATVLDIGAGNSGHAENMRRSGLDVDTMDFAVDGDYMTWEAPRHGYDAVWCSHVLEHMPDVGAFLKRIADNHLRPNGWLAVTVPPAKHNIVGGHVSLWNEGLLLYRLILAGFDCSQARVGVYGYNISVLVQHKYSALPALKHDNGDINALSPFFPFDAAEGFNGQVGNVNW